MKKEKNKENEGVLKICVWSKIKVTKNKKNLFLNYLKTIFFLFRDY
jgi:hypothetical protein